MSDLLSLSSSLIEEDLLFKDVPEAFLDPYKVIDDFKKELEAAFEEKKSQSDKVYEDIKQRTIAAGEERRRCEKEMETLREERERLSQREAELKVSLIESELKRTKLEEESARLAQAIVSEEQLRDVYLQLLTAEKENETETEELKRRKRILVGEMWYYKEYLDVYIDCPQKDDYILYFRRCQGKDKSRPDEWIRIRTANFVDYLLCDISERLEAGEQQQLNNSYQQGASLRQLVYQARRAFFKSL